MQALAGSDINLGSPKQLQELLFDELGLPGIKRTKTGWSTDADVLEELAPLHPVAAKILEYRELDKLKGTYIDALPRAGRSRATGGCTRASADGGGDRAPVVDRSQPAEHARSAPSSGARSARAFVAADGCVLIAADYSQIELRVLAHLSKDPVLLDAFRKDEDIHRRTVIEMFGADKADDKQLRRVAKTINYGIIYGLSDFGLAQRLGIERADAKRYIEGYLKTYAVARQVHGPHHRGRLSRRRHAHAARPLPPHPRAAGAQPHAALRRRAHGAQHADPGHRGRPPEAGDDRGAARDRHAIAATSRCCSTVHDELVLEVPADRGRRRRQEAASTRWRASPKLDVPLKVDLGIGKNWAEAK